MEKMKLIQRLIEREWTLFDKVRNIRRTGVLPG